MIFSSLKRLLRLASSSGLNAPALSINALVPGEQVRSGQIHYLVHPLREEPMKGIRRAEFARLYSSPGFYQCAQESGVDLRRAQSL
jgi:hypothetical protein